MRRLVALAVAVLLGVGYVDGASPARSAADPAKRTVVLAALGDSITTAAGTCGPFFRCYDHSWATGTEIHSVFRRLQATRPNLNIEPVNLAVPGAGVANLSTEAEQAVARKADFVTILIGANDVCQSTMDPQAFRAYLDDALAVLHEGRPKARLEMLSIPDIVHLWTISHGNLVALIAWQFNECPSMMTRAWSTSAADVRRRRDVAKLINAYNRELAKACRKYPHHRCHWDDGRTHRVTFDAEMVGLDYFHPSVRGQQELAKRSWFE